MLKLKDAIIGDYREEEVKETIQRKLKSIVGDMECDVPIEILEKLMFKIRKKYGVALQYLMPALQPEGHFYYSASFKRCDTHEWIGTINGITIYEVFAKGVLMAYSYAKKHDTHIH